MQMKTIARILRQTAEAESFRYIVERRHLEMAADEIDCLRTQKNAAEDRIESMQRELDMIKAENEFLKNKPGVR